MDRRLYRKRIPTLSELVRYLSYYGWFIDLDDYQDLHKCQKDFKYYVVYKTKKFGYPVSAYAVERDGEERKIILTNKNYTIL